MLLLIRLPRTTLTFRSNSQANSLPIPQSPIVQQIQRERQQITMVTKGSRFRTNLEFVPTRHWSFPTAKHI